MNNSNSFNSTFQLANTHESVLATKILLMLNRSALHLVRPSVNVSRSWVENYVQQLERNESD